MNLFLEVLATIFGILSVWFAKNNKIIAHDGSEISIESETLCVHSDTPDALVIAKAIKKKLNRS